MDEGTLFTVYSWNEQIGEWMHTYDADSLKDATEYCINYNHANGYEPIRFMVECTTRFMVVS